MQPVDVLFISMPFGPLRYPSIGLELLRASLRDTPVTTRSIYYSISFADRAGPDLYNYIADGRPSVPALLGEWVFSPSLFGEAEDRTYVADVLRRGSARYEDSEAVSDAMIQRLVETRSESREFIDCCADEIESIAPRIVCLTSVFQQHIPSLALARALRNRQPGLRIVLGGANCEGVMGLETIRQFPFLDAVVSGEADLVFPALIERLLSNDSVRDVPGVFTPEMPDTVKADDYYALPVSDMDTLPVPDYRQYFAQFDAFQQKHRDQTCALLFETSRGCWWGEKHHCTFCGLNGATMAFRSKSGRRALEELRALHRQRPQSPVFVVDNILDLKYFRDFLPALSELEGKLRLFYEVKANLRKDQVRMLQEAGISSIQPGIESLNTSVLRRMDKGTSALLNVQLLKWCRIYDVHPVWNILWGFPGEDPEAYEAMADLVPQITHLTPPIRTLKVRLDRFSPQFTDPGRYGYTDVKAYPAYAHVYPFSEQTVYNLAYYFVGDFEGRDRIPVYTRRFADAVDDWSNRHERVELFFIDDGDHLQIFDSRDGRYSASRHFTDLEREVLLETNGIRSRSQINLAVQGTRWTEEDLERALCTLVDDGFLMCEGNKYLCLVLDSSEYSPRETNLFSLIGQIGDFEVSVEDRQ